MPVMASSIRNRRGLRFNLAALLSITLCVCAYFGGYRRGFLDREIARAAPNLYAVNYDVGDLIVPMGAPDTPPARRAMGDQLINLITQVEPTSWMENGTGDGEIQWYESNASIVISQSQQVHGKIAALLASLRANPGAIAVLGAPAVPNEPAALITDPRP